MTNVRQIILIKFNHPARDDRLCLWSDSPCYARKHSLVNSHPHIWGQDFHAGKHPDACSHSRVWGQDSDTRNTDGTAKTVASCTRIGGGY